MRLDKNAAAGETGSGSRSCTAATAQCTSAGRAADCTTMPGANRTQWRASSASAATTS